MTVGCGIILTYRRSMGGQPGLPVQQGMQGGYPGSGYPGMPGAMGGPAHPVPMQHTGGSAFDPHFSPTAIESNGLQPPGPFQGQASRNSSPAGRASPGRPSGDQSGTRPSSSQSNPRPPQ